LKISPREQIFFLEKILRGTLPVSEHAIAMTKKITFLDVLNGWELHGKTGSGRLIHPDGTIDKELGSGWFIGWLEKNDRTIAFVMNLRDEVKTEGFASIRAKARALELLQPFTH
jgi:beta-lactamase class D